MNIDFANKIVVITGGSQGIGREFVKAFHKNGATVYFTYKTNEKAASKLLTELNSTNIYGLKVDGRDNAEVSQFIQDVGNKEKKIDILINNAGVVTKGLLPNIEPAVWDNAIQTNLSSIYHFTSKSLRWLIKSKNGVIINISSVVADRPGRGLAVYSTTKGALESLTKALAIEYAPFNIRVNSIAPGLIETEIAKSITEEKRQELLKRTPLGRFGNVEDVTNATLFLASDKAAYITGVQLYVTGGKHLD